MSKGHACPILYACWAEAGLFPVSDLQNLRKLDSDLEGHPTPRLSFIDVATGSLGQGLSCAAGMAWVGKNLDKADYRVYCLLGDGETAEGSVWEALSFSSLYQLDNLTAIFDINRLGQSQQTAFEHDIGLYKRRIEAFGWHTVVVDGHNVEALCKAFHESETVTSQPTAIIAKTFKGRNFPEIEDLLGFHGKAVGKKADAILAHLDSLIVHKGKHQLAHLEPSSDVAAVDLTCKLLKPPNYEKGKLVAPRFAFGVALAKLDNPRVLSIDGDVKNSTYADKFQAVHPERYVECFIAEQNMVGVGVGMGCRDRAVVFASSFAAFFSRAYDQLRMAAVSQTNLNICGSHCGVSIGADGPSQMALEDIAMFRAIPTCTVFYPSDPVSMERAVELAANTKGMCFIRSSRPETPVLYDNNETFAVGCAKIIRQSNNDQVTIVACAVTLFEAMKAAEALSELGINARLVDPFTIQPLDAKTIISCARATGGIVITVEDHYPQGGLGEAICSAVSEFSDITVHKMAVNTIPRSGSPAELLATYNINAPSIVKRVKIILKV